MYDEGKPRGLRIPTTVKWLLVAKVCVLIIGGGFLVWRWMDGAAFATDAALRIGLIVMSVLILIMLAASITMVVIENRRVPSESAPRIQVTPAQIPTAASTPEADLTHAPVVPADVAQGYGWAKASDLANQHDAAP